ncbi:glycoside hydrolase family 95 protein [Viscerimonas tarda]
MRFTLLTTLMLVNAGLRLFAADPVSFQKPNLVAKYDAPAEVWESEAMPIGNGYMGAMIFGGVKNDLIQVNENTIWSGGPGDNANYNGGHLNTPAINRQNYQRARTALQNKVSEFSANKAAYIGANGTVVTNNYGSEAGTEIETLMNSLKGTKDNFGSYQTLGNIEISYNGVSTPEVVNIQTDCNNTTNASEKVDKLFDGSITTKWFADKGFSGSFPCYIAWEYSSTLSIVSYSLTSGNDTPGRDPKSWKLYGSTTGTNYELIDTQTNVAFEGRRQTKTFTLSATQTYKFFKIEIDGVFAGNNTTSPQLSEIAVELASTGVPDPTNYARVLDIDNAIHTVTYNEGPVNYTREYFMSYPDNVLVVRLTASEAGKISRTFTVSSLHANKSISAAGNVITMTGQPTNHKSFGMKFAQQVKALNTGGSLAIQGNKIVVTGADEVLLLMSASTNYQQSMDDQFNYFSPVDPLVTVGQNISNAASKTYAQLLATHQADYKALYNRMGVNLGNITNVPAKTTNQLLTDFYKTNTSEENLYAEMLYYQFGRYLLISSSRKNTLPANLQGVWAKDLSNAWNADYHTNINVQMNYWLAQQTNLKECHIPMIEYINSLVPRGKVTAKYYHCKPDGSDVRGWVTYHENNVWGNTAPATSGAYYCATANGWLCQDIWEYYQFNKDVTFLEDNYPTLLEAALFWVDNLWRDTRDGSLVANPSYSPEHGEYSLGCASDQGIIRELFDMTIKASEVLGKNTPEIAEIKAAQSKLAGPQIGLNGQFMEWKDEVTRDITGDGGHRHANHLFWLHPGSQIVAGRSAQDDKYAEAMKKALTTRGDGGTGWSKSWKVNFWARLKDGDHAHKMLKEAMTLTYKDNPANIGGVYQNLFDTHPPFQIDGNFGVTSGVTEMLVQSQGGYIELLPALPADWSAGTFKGIKARGNFELNAQWTGSSITSAEITSNSGGDCTIKYPNIKDYTITQRGGGAVSATVINDNTVSFATTTGATYDISK